MRPGLITNVPHFWVIILFESLPHDDTQNIEDKPIGNVKNGVRVTTSVTAAGKPAHSPVHHIREYPVARLHIAVESPHMLGSAHQHPFIPGHIHRSAFA